jgi:SpoVK/Ycf46/Vps4 family AAA+-type ATPase
MPYLLFCGPSGCGKTNFGKAVATEMKAAFLPVQASDVLSRWIGQGERAIRAMFSVARAHAPCVIFIDEVESILEIRF